MVKEFEGKNLWALVLGGSSGLGLASAKKLAKHGFNICVVHRNPRSQMDQIQREFDQLAQQVEFISFNADAVKPDSRNQIIGSFRKTLGEKGKIKVLLHSIAKGNLKSMVDEHQPTLQSDDFAITINAMAISLFDWVSALQSAGLFADAARVLSFTSEGNSKVWKNYAAVSAAKVALEAITRNIAVEFAPYGITANCVQAGVTDTTSLRMIPGSEAIVGHTKRRNPFNRLTRPEDVANVVYLLCKDEASWINGSIIPVDGGEHIC
jgi:enoyl-[acyl-carrier protein] reductase I